jgi:hypothetical protein
MRVMLRLSIGSHMQRFVWRVARSVAVLFVPALVVCLAVAQANVTGQWTTLTTSMPINPVHVAMLHTGKILVVSGSGNVPTNTNYQAGIWDPVTNTITTQPIAWDMFCNGMSILPNGQPLITGGTLQYDPFHGQMQTAVFDPSTNVFTNVQSMAVGRWYPTTTVLGDGRLMVFSGLDVNGATTPTVEFFSLGTGWSTAITAPWTPPLYPRMHVLPNGKVFYSGAGANSALFDPISQTWSLGVATTNYGGSRTYGTSVLLPLTPANNYSPSVMIMGGGNPSTATTEIIDLSQASPTWQWGPSMSQPRIEMNAVILPTGKVLALGGSLNDEDNNTASLNADLYDPTTNTFSSAGANAYPRLYHSVALLLPDATVWVAGGNPQRGFYQTQVEIYQPAYLFTTDANGNIIPATRPTIGNAPANVAYGSTFSVGTPDAGSIGSIALIRAGAVTHAFDMDQRMLGLSFTADLSTNTLNVTAPATGNLAPPGYYLLFLLNSAGVPSLGTWVQLGAPDFSLTATPASRTVQQGAQALWTATLTPLNGFSGTVNLSALGLPPGVTATFSKTTLTGGNATLTVNVGASVAPGSYPFTITATGGGLTHSVPATLVVRVRGSFTITLTPSAQTVTRNSTSTYTVTVTPSNGFQWTVNLKSNSTAHIKTSLSASSIVQSGTVVLTVNVDGSASLGLHTIAVTGTSGQVSRTAKLALTIQ